MVVLVFFILLDRLGRGRRVVMNMALVERLVAVCMHMLVLVGVDEIAVAVLVSVTVHVLVDVRFRCLYCFVCHVISP
jgi:hypothetical protein